MGTRGALWSYVRCHAGLIATLVVTAPAWLPVLHPWFSAWRLFDGEAHLLRAYFYSELVAQGNWLPRWMPQQYGGYGYPTLNFYAPGLYVLMWLLALPPRVGLYEAFQALAAAGGAGLVAGTYTLGQRLWRMDAAAFLAATTVAYAPYLLHINLFTMGAIPAVLGMALAVWLLLACDALWSDDGARWWWSAALLTAALLLVHNVSALFAAGMVATWLVWLALGRDRTLGLRLLAGRMRRAAGAALFGAGVTAFAWLPALLETSLVQIERMFRGNLHYRNHFIIWPGFNSPLWGEPSRAGWTLGFPLDLHLLYPYVTSGPPRWGLWQGVALAGAALALGVWLLGRLGGQRIGRKLDRRPAVALSAAYGIVLALVCYAQLFDWALPLWERFAALRAIQWPWRLLGPAAIGLGLAAGGALALQVRHRGRAWALAAGAATVMALSALAGRPLPLDAEAGHQVTVETAIGRERVQPGSTASTDEFLPRTTGFEEWHENEARGFWLYDRMFPEAGWLGGRALPWQGNVAILGLSGGALWTVADVEVGATRGTGVSGETGVIAFHQLAFPGWRAWVDGRPVSPSIAPEIASQAIRPGFLLVEVPAGRHSVAVRFGPDLPRLAGGALACATLLGAAVYGVAAVRAAPRGRRRTLLLTAAALAGVTALSAGVRLALPILPPRPGPGERIVTASVIDEVAAGRASVVSPSGSALGADRFVDVRALAIQPQDRPLRDAGPRTRRWLYMHPPSEVSVEVSVPVGGFLQTALAMEPAMWDAPLGDGVRFLATVTPVGGGGGGAGGTTVLDAWLNPRGAGEQRRWVEQVVDLRPWAGQRVRLTLRTDGRQEPNFDWAGWAEPVVVTLDPLTGARLLDGSKRVATLALKP